MKGLPRAMARRDLSRSAAVRGINKLTVPIVGLVVPIPDAGAVAVSFATAVLGDFPEGNILFLGAVGYFRFTRTDTDLVATFTPTFSVGTEPSPDAVLTGAEVDILPSTAGIIAVAGVSGPTRVPSVAAASGAVFDNTAGELELNLNVTIPDADISADSGVTVNGSIVLSYVVLGDD